MPVCRLWVCGPCFTATETWNCFYPGSESSVLEMSCLQGLLWCEQNQCLKGAFLSTWALLLLKASRAESSPPPLFFNWLMIYSIATRVLCNIVTSPLSPTERVSFHFHETHSWVLGHFMVPFWQHIFRRVFSGNSCEVQVQVRCQAVPDG